MTLKEEVAGDEPLPGDGLHGLWRRQQEQGVRLEALSRRCAELVEHSAAMHECLQASGTLTAEAFCARLHRRRFHQVLARHPCQCSGSLEALLQNKDMTVAMARHADLGSVNSLAVASTATRHGMGLISAEVATLFPPLIYAIGGEGVDGRALTSAERFNPSRGTWEVVPPLKTARMSCGAAAITNKVYIVGGRRADGFALSSVERFNPLPGIWEEMPPMRAARGEVSAVAFSGRLCAVGGRDDPFVLDTVEILDVEGCSSEQQSTRASTSTPPSPRSISSIWEATPCTWAVLPAMHTERRSAGAAVVDGCVYAIGGQDVGDVVLRDVERLSAGFDYWERLPPLRTPRASLAAAATGHRHLFVAGGYDGDFREVLAVERFDPVACHWETVGPMQVPKTGLGMVRACKSLYLLGGTAFGGLVVDTVDQIALDTAGWEPAPNMHIARRLFGAAACC